MIKLTIYNSAYTRLNVASKKKEGSQSAQGNIQICETCNKLKLIPVALVTSSMNNQGMKNNKLTSRSR